MCAGEARIPGVERQGVQEVFGGPLRALTGGYNSAARFQFFVPRDSFGLKEVRICSEYLQA
jgi:hypothetical protein